MKRALKLLTISDTHQEIYLLQRIVKEQSGDIFIHAGDFTKHGQQKYFQYFLGFLEKVNFKHKIVIAGNHEIALDNTFIDPQYKQKSLEKYPCKYGRQYLVKELKKRAIYLEHEEVQVEGLKIFGSPCSPFYSGSAFQYLPEQQEPLWSKIPQGLDILLTHCPPYGILDLAKKDKHGGSKVLREIVQKKKPKVHIFGHIHQGRGNEKVGDTIFLNTAKKPFKLEI